MNPAGRAEEIKQRALVFGFDLVGIASAQAPRHAQEFQQWLASGFHGEMGYMARNAEKRVDPSKILTDVRSAVVVGLNYYCGDHGVSSTYGRPTPDPSQEGNQQSDLPSSG